MGTFEMKNAVIEELKPQGITVSAVRLRYVPGPDTQMQVIEIDGTFPDGTTFTEATPAHHMNVDTVEHIVNHVRTGAFLDKVKAAQASGTKH